MKITKLFAIGLIAWAFTAGCNDQKVEPQIASSANHAGYAKSYPDAMEGAVKEFSDGEEEVKTILNEMPGYPEQLDNPNWAHVQEVIERADEAGRSWTYVERAREVRSVQTFYEAEKSELHKKAAGSAQYMVNQKGCQVNIHGAVAGALDKAVEKQLEERLRERNEAHQVIDRYRESLGKKNAETLEDQADKISYASYLTHINLVEVKIRLRGMVEEGEQVKSTLDDEIEKEKKFQQESGRTDKEKQASEERIAAMTASKERVDQTVEQTRQIAEKLDERTQQLQTDYGNIMGALKQQISSSVDSQPAPSEPEKS